MDRYQFCLFVCDIISFILLFIFNYYYSARCNYHRETSAIENEYLYLPRRRRKNSNGGPIALLLGYV